MKKFLKKHAAKIIIVLVSIWSIVVIIGMEIN